ncbi:MAG: hypothetical protein O7D29_03150 [Gemmatimonadetes bacterium]|nr:hypothetical protein [Gemmatimonadota bacterium]
MAEIVEGGNSLATRLVELASARAEFFHDRDRECYATFKDDDHRETWPIASQTFHHWLSHHFYSAYKKAPSASGLRDAITTIMGKALYEATERQVHLRVAQSGGTIFIDLCNDDWEAVTVTASGYTVISNPPVRFRRTRAMRSLPRPEPGGDISDLWPFMNVTLEDDQRLLTVWLAEALRSDTPFPILVFEGEQGSGKSSAQDRLRSLTDPSRANLRAAPRKIEDIFVGAATNWVVSFNNLTHLSAGQQEALCTLSTGGGYAARTLYTNLDETVAEVKRPVVLNGINTLATAQDLIDRCFTIELPVFERSARKPERALNREFEEVWPRLFGALLNTVSGALRELPGVELSELPRMADFALLGVAVERALGWPPGSFMDAYHRKRVTAVRRGLDASPIAQAIQEYVSTHPSGYEGTVKELFDNLEEYQPSEGAAWPKSARGLGDALRRNSTALRTVGINIAFDPTRQNDGYHVKIIPVSQSSQGSRSTQVSERRERGEHESTRVSDDQDRERFVL